MKNKEIINDLMGGGLLVSQVGRARFLCPTFFLAGGLGK
jgi:hypothetical protein